MEQFLSQYPVHTRINVAWGEMDALQHVNNAVYFRYFETARIDFFGQLGLLEQGQKMQIGPIISENQARYRRPVTFPDSLLVGVNISDIGQDRFLMNYAVFSQAQKVITTTGSSLVVMYDFKTGQKMDLPPELVDVLKAQEAAKA
ncbi:acyl-CoA thioesterase [Shewanella gelidii]|uniref:Thioesterase n=1 Tax=Shewanella gelidii TaxID=1642821 RepID=A0A917JZW7_9GAMM|nr:thioesterase family protein [Shewanella gelidii]MCL1098944.1 acyl-CoA thioesterase [Shewanella gelidii]GGI90161.1 thioesterase [Shewanella gelidii]